MWHKFASWNRVLPRWGSSSGGGGSQAPQTVVQNTSPWDKQQPYLERIYGLAEDAYEAQPKETFQGTLNVGPTAAQQTANQQLIDLSTALGGVNLGQDVINQGLATARGDYLNPATNPAITGAIDAAIDPVYRNFEERILPQLQSAAIAGGAYSGNRNAERFASQDLNTTAADLAGRIGYQAYDAERNRQFQAPALIQSGVALEGLSPSLLATAGDIQQQWDSVAAQESYRRFVDEQTKPWIGLPELSGLIQAGFPGQSGVSTYNYNQPSSISQTIQGALGGGLTGGLGAAAAFGQSSPYIWPLAAGGAVLGGLGGGL